MAEFKVAKKSNPPKIKETIIEASKIIFEFDPPNDNPLIKEFVFKGKVTFKLNKDAPVYLVNAPLVTFIK